METAARSESLHGAFPRRDGAPPAKPIVRPNRIHMPSNRQGVEPLVPLYGMAPTFRMPVQRGLVKPIVRVCVDHLRRTTTMISRGSNHTVKSETTNESHTNCANKRHAQVGQRT